MRNRNIIVTALFLIGAILVSGCSGTTDVVSDPSAAKNGDTVQLNYAMKLDDGTILFDTFTAGAPVELMLGKGNMLSAFEKAVIGMKVGEKKTITIPMDEAYGPYRKELVIEVPLSQLPQDKEPKLGMKLQQQQPDGSIITATIIEISLDTVTLDTNNELAGKDLTYEIELLKIL
jgi:peptidylprolyl isomerase